MDYFTKRKLTIWVLVLLLIINITAMVTIYVQSKTKINLPGVTSSEKSDVYELLNKELNLSEEQSGKVREIIDEHRYAVDLIKEEIQDNRFKVAEELLSESPDTTILRELWEKMGNLHTKLEKLNALHFMKLRASVDSVQKRKFLIIMKEFQEKNKEKLEKELTVIPEKVREQLKVLDTLKIKIPRVPELPNFTPDNLNDESIKKYELKMEKFGEEMKKFGEEMGKFGEEMNRMQFESIEVPDIKIKIPDIRIEGLDPQKQEEINKKIEEKMKEVEKKIKEKNEELKEKNEKLKEKNEKMKEEHEKLKEQSME